MAREQTGEWTGKYLTLGGIHRLFLKAGENCFPRKMYVNTKFDFQFQEVGDHPKAIHGLLEAQIKNICRLKYHGGNVSISIKSMVGKDFL